ncbi:HD domain-containing protein [Bombilactobacillus thymidiniphilus]|uniref:HD domain-containing protein n=1 Tax=Bombilactobacillus thymidiniphilus TaxID=2923363 RepID=A0ABY4PE35_9LACO|nr:HD domain-containing protein [Bombilactobacillus thymidiniphilus]UQS84043.1 HD domain-containing protein [Bombilactobacillus thymidiniphilus]
MEQTQFLLPHEKVFRDPVHKYIHIENRIILDLINTPEFQRLRRIKQLGTTSMTFHGAEHTRFAHCLGVYEITRRICDNFARNYPSKKTGDGLWNDDERLVALCAALLHDIGHGPYSHTFEHIFNTDHEAWTRQIITSPQTEVNQILRHVSSDFPEKVASVIAKTYPNEQVVQMISSQIDSDRMDYLLRDAYFTGTNYGTFDLDRIMRVIRPYQDGIAFNIEGMHAIEDYIVSRFQMYQQVYFHPVSRGMEVVLLKLLQRAQFLYHNQQLTDEALPQLLVPFFQKKISVTNYLRLDDDALNTYFNLWRDHPDSILRDLVHRFLDRHPFKSITYQPEQIDLVNKMRDWVKDAGFTREFYSALNNSFDLPYDSYDPSSKEPKTQIELIQPDDTLVELSTKSDIVSALSGHFTGDQRLYFPKEMLLDPQNRTLTPYLQNFQEHINNNSLVN